MPVWQEFYEKHKKKGLEILAVAIDFQGEDIVQPYVDQARATYPNAVDIDNSLSDVWGFRVIPNGIFVDEVGIIRYIKLGGFDIRQSVDRKKAERFAENPDLAELERQSEQILENKHPEALKFYQQGLERYKQGDVQTALVAWRRSIEREPDNWIVRKQIWAIEHPEKFYDGKVDFDWQKAQIDLNR